MGSVDCDISRRDVQPTTLARGTGAAIATLTAPCADGVTKIARGSVRANASVPSRATNGLIRFESVIVRDKGPIIHIDAAAGRQSAGASGTT